MPATTPPKGRPTPGRRDRSVAQHRAASRRRIIRYVWAVVALALVVAVLVLGSGTGGNANVNTNLVVPGLLPAAAWLRATERGHDASTVSLRRYHQ